MDSEDKAKKESRKNLRARAEQAECSTETEKVINRQLRNEIEQRKFFQEELQASEVRFRRLFETAQDGILILDFDSGQITEVNPFLEDLLGYAREDFLKKKLWEIGVFKDVRASKAIFKKLKDKGYVRYEDLPLQTRDGRIIEVEFVSNVYKAGNKKVIQCNIRDVAERVRLEHIKEGITNKVYHEITNPLAIISEGLNLILDKAAGDINKEQEIILASVNSAIERLIRIMTDLLDMSKLEAGRIDFHREPVNVKKLIKEVALLFELKIQGKDLEIRLKLPEREINIYSDRDKMFQIFFNLLNNAVKFTEEGRIEVSVVEKEDYIEFGVSDTGRGISKNDISEIFGKFKQFGEILKGNNKGMGLGLAITKNIVELGKGKIWIESELGKGTKVSFTLPNDIEAKKHYD